MSININLLFTDIYPGRATKPVTIITFYFITASNGKTAPAGATVVIATYKLHRRPEIYPNPDKFNPDNFLPEKSANRHYYAFVPFSAGPRSCVGGYT